MAKLRGGSGWRMLPRSVHGGVPKRGSTQRRGGACFSLAVALLAGNAALGVAPAGAQAPPTSPPAGPAYVQAVPCSSTWLDPEHPLSPGAHLAQLGMERAWALSRGSGQVIAIVDTGVVPHPRLPRLRGAGDLIGTAEGLADCDAHGTLVAGLAAGSGGSEGFFGMAPDAEIVSVRQSSEAYRAVAPNAADDRTADAAVSSSGSVRSLAQAVRRAADSGATVINISEVACVPRGTALADAELTEALRYAVLERDIVVVVAAGNVEGPCSDGNPESADPRDPAGEKQLRTIASPAWYDELVLTVGAVDHRGVPADFSLPGPWVDVAAPGVGLTSLSVTGPGSIGPIPETATAVVNGQGQLAKLEGTSFAAPLVAGLAALVRSRFPELTATQVMQRITQTALGARSAGTDLRVGAGMIDPLAALSTSAPLLGDMPNVPVALSVPATPPPDFRQRRRAEVLALLAVVVAAALAGGRAWKAALGREATRV